jgi:predicted nucleic acid-binding protein
VPEAVVGEAFTKLRYDRRISPRKDASVALTIFKLLDASPDLFEVRPAGRDTHRWARDILTQYMDQSFSYVDAVVFAAVDNDPTVDQILTVDGRDFSTYRFAHSVEIIVP